MKCAMLKCFHSVEVAYAYDKTTEVLPPGEALCIRVTLWHGAIHFLNIIADFRKALNS